MRPCASFVVATPYRSVCDQYARLLVGHNLLRRYALWTRRGTEGIPQDLTRLRPMLGLAAYAAAKLLSPYRAESFRFALYPRFDRWVTRQLQLGDSVISSYGYANTAFAWARKEGGLTFLDAGNSHPDQFWEILEEEHRRWNSPYPPIARFHYERSRQMLEDVDYVLSPSKFVTESFLARGFARDRILPVVYPVDLSRFQPPESSRSSNRPLTIVNTGLLSLRKGTPYLLEAFRLIRRTVPDARLLLTRAAQDTMRALLPRYGDLPIEWAPPLPHDQLAQRLRSADLFILPSLEEGLVRTALEAMACGLPVILTPNTGANDYVQEGVNGSVVPIRDPAAICQAALSWWEKIQAGQRFVPTGFQAQVNKKALAAIFDQHLRRLGYLSAAETRA